jgi:hypothetical protein
MHLQLYREQVSTSVLGLWRGLTAPQEPPTKGPEAYLA